MTKGASIRVGCYDHETIQIAEVTLKEKLKPDSHAVPSLLVRPDDRLIAFYAKHYDKKASYYRVSENPEDISAWGPDMQVGTDGGYSDFTNVVQLSKCLSPRLLCVSCRGKLMQNGCSCGSCTGTRYSLEWERNSLMNQEETRSLW